MNQKITGGTIIEDNVQIGARVVTVNDKAMTWRNSPVLVAPIFREQCRVGSGATILAGIEIGAAAFVGAGSTVTKPVPPDVIAWGSRQEFKER